MHFPGDCMLQVLLSSQKVYRLLPSLEPFIHILLTISVRLPMPNKIILSLSLGGERKLPDCYGGLYDLTHPDNDDHDSKPKEEGRLALKHSRAVNQGCVPLAAVPYEIPQRLRSTSEYLA